MIHFRSFRKNQKGFTLIELLVVIGILAILFTLVLTAINPQKQFQQANNTERNSEVSAILNAISTYQTENAGAVPAGIGASAAEISDTGVDLCSVLVPEYIAQLPVDPLVGDNLNDTDCAGAYATGYEVAVSAADNRVTVTAPSAELGEIISIKR